MDKVKKCISELEYLISQKRATLRQIQSIVGLLNFACAVVLPGRPFLSRLNFLERGLRAPHHHTNLSKGSKEDMRLWLQFLKNFNGKSLFLNDRLLTNHDINLYTDASGKLGYGAVFGNNWFYGSWSEWWLSQNITLLELYPIVIAIEVWGASLKNKCLQFFVDNEALVDVLGKQSSSEPLVMVLVCRLVLLCLQFNLVLTVKHIYGTSNIAADLLSRLQVERFRSSNPSANASPTPIPILPSSVCPEQPTSSLGRH